MRQINGGDAFFLYLDRQSRHQHISTLYIYDPSTAKESPLRFKTIMQTMEERLGASPIFRQRLVNVPFNLDYPYWVNDPDFDLEYHVRHLALPKPGDWRQLCILVSRLHSRSLDMTRPVWESYVIEGLDNIDFLPEGSFAIMTKIHHVAIDGISAAQLTLGLHDTEPDPQHPRRPVRWRPGHVPSAASMLSRAGVNNVRATLKSSRTLLNRLGSAAKGMGDEREDTSSLQPAGPPTRFNDPISPHRVWDAVRFSMDDIRAMRAHAPGATVNDIVLTVCGGAMTRYLDSKQELPDRDLTSMVPVSVRSESEQGQAGNKVHLTRTTLCTTERNPIERLKKVREVMQKIKAINASSARGMVEVQEQLPAPTLMMAGRALSAGPGKSYRQTHNMIITNVPGSATPLYFCGARLVMLTGMAVISDNLGISHVVTSYDGTLVIAPLSDREMMPDPAFYADCLKASFAELQAALLNQKPVSDKAPANPARAPRKARSAPRGKASGAAKAARKTPRKAKAAPKAAPKPAAN